jgi:hypothetical protein
LLELDAAKIRELLAQLDDRLKARGVKASVYLVGGAAMTLEYGREGLTADIDAVVSHQAVFAEARRLAAEHGLPESWLNSNAGGWVPPRPDWARRHPTELGLTVHVAPAEHVLAMKLVAQRRKDRPDIRALIQRCEMVNATAEEYADFLEQIYSGEDQLAQMLGVGSDPEDVRSEAVAIGEWAHGFVADLR